MKILQLFISVMLSIAFLASCDDKKNQPIDPTSEGGNNDETTTSAIDYRLITGGSSWARELLIDETNGKVPKKVVWTFSKEYEFTELTEMSDNTVVKTRSGEWSINTDENILTLSFYDENDNETGEEDYIVSTLNSEKMVVMFIFDSVVGEPITYTSIETPPLPTDDTPEEPDDNKTQAIDISEPIVTDITTSSAVVKGTILGDNVTFKERGVCYSTSHNPTINDNKAEMSTDVVNIHLENLFEGTVYYIRLYAIIDDIVYYGKEVSFETEGTRTYKIDLTCDRIADQSFRLQAKVPNEVGKYGLCYGTSPHPKVTDDYLTEQDRATSWIIKDIKPNTTYYIRAYHKEGTKITYFEDSEINVRTLGPDGTDIKLDFTCEKENSDGFCNGVSYTITYSNLPKGMNEIIMYIREQKHSRSEKITKYTEKTSGTLTINPTKINVLWGSWYTELCVCVKNYETGIWYVKTWEYRASSNPRFGEEDDEYKYFDYFNVSSTKNK